MTGESKVFSIDLRVRYEETDQMGVVYYANYFTWFEVARTECFRAKGIDYRKLEEREKIYLPVVEARCTYKKAVGYDDMVTIKVTPEKLSSAKLAFSYMVEKKGVLVAEGYTLHVFLNEKRRPVAIPSSVEGVFR